MVIEFASYEEAMTCYRSPEYQQAIALRKAAADIDFSILEGYDGAQPKACGAPDMIANTASPAGGRSQPRALR
jgi:hypothetical protein